MFENITVVGGPLILSSAAEVDAAEAELAMRFPAGYREYVTQLGEGILGGTYIRIYPPNSILNGRNSVFVWRRRIDECWFWDAGRAVLTKKMALQAVIIGDTLGGDELLVHPSNPERILVLPHDSDGSIHVAGHDLAEAIEWLYSSGTLTEAFDERDFEPCPAVR